VKVSLGGIRLPEHMPDADVRSVATSLCWVVASELLEDTTLLETASPAGWAAEASGAHSVTLKKSAGTPPVEIDCALTIPSAGRRLGVDAEFVGTASGRFTPGKVTAMAGKNPTGSDLQRMIAKRLAVDSLTAVRAEILAAPVPTISVEETSLADTAGTPGPAGGSTSGAYTLGASVVLSLLLAIF